MCETCHYHGVPNATYHTQQQQKCKGNINVKKKKELLSTLQKKSNASVQTYRMPDVGNESLFPLAAPPPPSPMERLALGVLGGPIDEEGAAAAAIEAAAAAASC